jgi:hypothetical protein
MAISKKKVAAAQPVISEIPMPISDSPLVIDLPDGQKLVVGKMSAGTVIEVATWRGTGRPDSRTSRLMLGMSTSDQVQAQTDAQESTEGKVSKLPWKKIPALKSLDLSVLLRTLLKYPQAIFSKIRRKDKKLPQNEIPLTSTVWTNQLNDGDDIEIWLDKMTENVREKTEKKNVPIKKAPTKKAAIKKAPVKKSAPKKKSAKRA